MRTGHEPTHDHFDLSNEVRNPYDIAWERELGTMLCRAYPKCNWWVECNSQAGVAYVSIPDLHDLGNKRYAYTIWLKHLKDADDFKNTVKKCGELLERAHVNPRTGEQRIDKVDRSH